MTTTPTEGAGDEAPEAAAAPPPAAAASPPAATTEEGPSINAYTGLADELIVQVRSLETWGLIALGLAGGFLLDGAVGAAIGLIAAIVTAGSIAFGRAQRDFARAYADSRGLELLEEGADLPEVTPLLQTGHARTAENLMAGTLPGGAPGMLAHYTSTRKRLNAAGRYETKELKFTVALSELPAEGPVRQIYCNALRFIRASSLPAGVVPVKLESAAFADRFELLRGEGDDERWMRRLFQPSFIVWMAEEAPESFAFELVDRRLCCYVEDHIAYAEQLDSFCRAGSKVFERVTQELAQTAAAR